MRRCEISDADWDRIENLLPGRPGLHGGVAEDNRRFVNAVLWVALSGAPRRDLHERFGNWNSIWRRFVGSDDGVTPTDSAGHSGPNNFQDYTH
jgi:transposase